METTANSPARIMTVCVVKREKLQGQHFNVHTEHANRVHAN